MELPGLSVSMSSASRLPRVVGDGGRKEPGIGAEEIPGPRQGRRRASAQAATSASARACEHAFGQGSLGPSRSGSSRCTQLDPASSVPPQIGRPAGPGPPCPPRPLQEESGPIEENAVPIPVTPLPCSPVVLAPPVDRQRRPPEPRGPAPALPDSVGVDGPRL